MPKYDKALTSEEWGRIYNPSIVNNIIHNIEKNEVSIWSEELVRITSEGEKILEVGCGTGLSSVWLAMHNREAYALDYSEDALQCARAVADKMKVNIHLIHADATKELPFEKDTFSTIFQAGLLEHFEQSERIKLLKLWKPYGKRMISLIPNAASIAYRTGKAMMERQGTWEYGKETPQYTMVSEFEEAGFENVREYTIGEVHALSFLPKRHYLRKALEKWIKENACEDNCAQGYLLVTVGYRRDK